MFLCKNSTHLAHIAILFSHIIEQENSFLLQLTSFQVMLQNAEIITSPSIPKANNNQNLAKRNVVQPFSKKKSLFFADLPSQSPIFARNKTSDVMTKVKRSIGDIFKPYSVTSIGDTANLNYKRMNKNFNSIQVSESKLAHAQSALSDNFFNLQQNEVDLLRKEIFLELRTLKESALNSFIFDLQQILSTNHLDKSCKNNFLFTSVI